MLLLLVLLLLPLLLLLGLQFLISLRDTRRSVCLLALKTFCTANLFSPRPVTVSRVLRI